MSVGPEVGWAGRCQPGRRQDLLVLKRLPPPVGQQEPSPLPLPLRDPAGHPLAGAFLARPLESTLPCSPCSRGAL